MARTPLMHALQQFVSEHAEAADRGILVEQVRDERLAKINRRDLLKGAGALAAGVVGAQLLVPTSKAHALSFMSNKPRIAIVV